MADPQPRVWPERLFLVVGLLLRALLPFTFDQRWGFDFIGHEPYLRWCAEHWAFPPYNLSVESFHPIGYYRVGGLLLALGLPLQALSAVSALAGCVRLLAIWIGLRAMFPARPTVRWVAMAVAALLPSALQIDGMANGEALHSALAALALLCVVSGLQRQDRRLAILAGLVVGLALWVKVSAVVLLALLGIAALLDGWNRRARALPWLGAILLAAVVASPQYLHNLRIWGVLLPNSFNTTQLEIARRTVGIPLWRRRPAEFFLGWETAFFHHPFASEDPRAKAHFPSSMVASTFVDHYSYRFVWPPPTSTPPVRVNHRDMPESAFFPAQLSFAGGTVLFVVVVAAWCASLVAALRRRERVWLAGLSLPALAIAAQLHFTVAYPFDDYGVIKGAYVQFGAAPLYALVGVAVEWLLAQRRRFTAALVLASLATVGFYTLFARTVALLHPLGK